MNSIVRYFTRPFTMITSLSTIQELEERRDEIDLLETELAATRKALSDADAELEHYAKLLRESDYATLKLAELFVAAGHSYPHDERLGLAVTTSMLRNPQMDSPFA